MRVTLKLATSLDGRIATASGESRWITGEKAREEVHRLRLVHLAVMVGVETVIADDPELTVRLGGNVGIQPRRIVLDSRLRTPLASKLVQTAKRIPTLVVSTKPSNKRLIDAGVTVLQVAEAEGRVDPRAALAALETQGVMAVMIEGGGQVAASFIAAGLVDAIEWFRAPIVLGDEGRPAIGGFVLKALKDAPQFRRIEVREVGPDLWERYEDLMFTGIVTDVGRVRSIRDTNRDRRFEIETSWDTATIDMGASISHAGCCLTVVDKGPGWFAVEVSGETLDASTLDEWNEGRRVNLERAARAGDEMGGHIVSGHVDGVGEVLSIEPEGGSHRIRVKVPRPLHRYIAPKGSISIEGVSLTVNEVEDDVFGVNIIPHTWDVTTLGTLKAGSRVNLEIDMLARYLARWQETAP